MYRPIDHGIGYYSAVVRRRLPGLRRTRAEAKMIGRLKIRMTAPRNKTRIISSHSDPTLGTYWPAVCPIRGMLAQTLHLLLAPSLSLPCLGLSKHMMSFPVPVTSMHGTGPGRGRRARRHFAVALDAPAHTCTRVGWSRGTAVHSTYWRAGQGRVAHMY